MAVAFAILQIGSDGSDKVRRGEDWRRSGHNSTIHVTDAPHHHDVEDYIYVARRLRHGISEEDVANIWDTNNDPQFVNRPTRPSTSSRSGEVSPDTRPRNQTIDQKAWTSAQRGRNARVHSTLPQQQQQQ